MCLLSFFFSHVFSNQLPIYTVDEIIEEVKYIDTQTGYYCYVCNNTNVEDLNFRFTVFKIMVTDLHIITTKNSKFCIIHDENALTPVLRVFKQKMKTSDYPIPETDVMIRTWGDQLFGSTKIQEVVKRFTYFYKELKSDLRELYEMKQNEQVQQEIKKTENKIEFQKGQILRNQQSLFETREKQRQFIKEYLETEGTDQQKHRYKAILKYDPYEEEEIDDFDININNNSESDENDFDNLNQKEKNTKSNNKRKENKYSEDEMDEKDEDDKYFEEMFIKQHQKRFLDELHKAKDE